MANEIQEFRCDKGGTWTSVVEKTVSGTPAADICLRFKRATTISHAEMDDVIEYLRQAALKTDNPFNSIP